MALAYDFDIFEVIPHSGSTDPQLDGFLSDAGFRPGRDLSTVALFRDPRTARALHNAPTALRDYFLKSGFGLNTYSSGAPPGRYPARDEAARLALIQRLTDTARRHPLPGGPEDSAEGGDLFRLGAFLAALDQCEPIDMADSTGPDRSGGALPPVFDTDPIPDPQPDAEAAPMRRKFWQSRFFRLGAAAALVLAAVQLASGPALSVLASL